MKNVIKINGYNVLNSDPNNTTIEKFIDVVGAENPLMINTLHGYLLKYELIAIDIKTLELVAGNYGEKNDINLEYFKKFPENQVVSLEGQINYVQFESFCINNNTKLWGKIKDSYGGGYAINFDIFPLWGTRKARLVDLLKND